MRILLILFAFFFLYCCKPYSFVKKGHFVDGVDEYFNLKQQRNIWVYMDFLAYDASKGYGVRTDSLYPEDRAILDEIGLKGKHMNVYFSAVSKNYPNYHFVVLQHRKKAFDYHDYELFQDKSSHYFYKDFSKDFWDVRHVVIPHGKDNSQLLTMVYYVDKDRNLTNNYRPLSYLATINAREWQQQSPFNNSWQVFDCERSDLIHVSFKIRHNLTKKQGIIYLKMYALYRNDRGIAYAKILTKKDADSLSLNLCPNLYRIEYHNLKGEVLQVDSLSVGM